MHLDPETVKLSSLNKQIEYEKIARELDECDDLEVMRNAAKCFLKLQLKQLETLSVI